MGARCRRFESCHSDHKAKRDLYGLFFCFYGWDDRSIRFCSHSGCRFAYRLRYLRSAAKYTLSFFRSDSSLRCLPSANRILFRLWRMLHSDHKAKRDLYGLFFCFYGWDDRLIRFCSRSECRFAYRLRYLRSAAKYTLSFRPKIDNFREKIVDLYFFTLHYSLSLIY